MSGSSWTQLYQFLTLRARAAAAPTARLVPEAVEHGGDRDAALVVLVPGGSAGLPRHEDQELDELHAWAKASADI
jgi:hypothetical protein